LETVAGTLWHGSARIAGVWFGKTYFHRVHRPLQCLVFITPLLLFYPDRIICDAAGAGGGRWELARGGVRADAAVLRVFRGGGERAAAAGGDCDFAVLAFGAERSVGFRSAAVCGDGRGVDHLGDTVCDHRTGAAAASAGAGGGGCAGGGCGVMADGMVLSVGAGVYEELLFRLIAINLLSMIFMDVFEMKPGEGYR